MAKKKTPEEAFKELAGIDVSQLSPFERIRVIASRVGLAAKAGVSKPPLRKVEPIKEEIPYAEDTEYKKGFTEGYRKAREEQIEITPEEYTEFKKKRAKEGLGDEDYYRSLIERTKPGEFNEEMIEYLQLEEMPAELPQIKKAELPSYITKPPVIKRIISQLPDETSILLAEKEPVILSYASLFPIFGEPLKEGVLQEELQREPSKRTPRGEAMAYIKMLGNYYKAFKSEESARSFVFLACMQTYSKGSGIKKYIDEAEFRKHPKKGEARSDYVREYCTKLSEVL